MNQTMLMNQTTGLKSGCHYWQFIGLPRKNFCREHPGSRSILGAIKFRDVRKHYWLKFISLAFFILNLVACNQLYYFHQMPYDVALCKKNCVKRALHCQGVCRNNVSVCQQHAKFKRGRRYCRYVHEQGVRGSMIIRRIDAYRDPLQCTKTTCDCVADYQVCDLACRGTLTNYVYTQPMF